MSNPFQDFLDDSSMNEAASVSVTVQAGAPAAQKYAVTEIHPRKSPRGRTRWVDVSYHSSAEEAKAAADAHAKKNNLHRMQVSATQGFNEALDTFEQAMAHKKQADAAMDKNDLESYHMHMSAHHESMGQWQESKGRQGNADKEYEKAEKHHELGVKKAGQKNESYKLDEKHTVGSPVEIVGGPSKGVKGRIGEVRPSSTATGGRKMYTVYHGANNTVLVPRDYIRAIDESEMQDVTEGSGPKEKQKTPYRDINSPAYRAAADKQKQQMAKDTAAEPGKKLADTIAKKKVAEGEMTAWQKLLRQNKKNDPTRVPRGQEITAHGKLVKKSKKEQPNQGVGGLGNGVTEGSDKKLEFNSFAAAKQHFNDLAHERGTSPVEMYGKGDAERYRQHVLKHVKKKEQAVAEEVELDEARAGTFRAGSKSYFKAGQTAIKNIKAAAQRRREEEAKQEADAKKKVEEEFGLAEGYSVIWTDRNYKKNSKDFVARKLGSPDSNERKARDFAKKLESNPDIRSVRVKSMTSEGVDLDEAVSVEHDRYMRSHGKKASGSEASNWMFTHKRYGNVDYKNSNEVHQTRGSFADAAKSAKQWAKSHGHSTVYVMEGVELEEKTLTPAELKKREEIAKAMEREKPGMDKSRKMAIATAVAKRVAEQYDEAE